MVSDTLFNLLSIYIFNFLLIAAQLWKNLRDFHYYGNTDDPDLLFPFIYKQYEKQNNRIFSKTNDNSEQNAATSAVCKKYTSIEIEFPEKKLWDKPSACTEKFSIFNVSNRTKTQSEKAEMSQIQLKEKRKFESFNEKFAEKPIPISVSKKTESKLVKSLDDSYGLIFPSSKKHRFDDEVDSVPDFLAHYLTTPSTDDTETPQSSKHCSATNEVNHKLNDMSVLEKKDSSMCSSSKQNIKEIKNVINFDDSDVLEKVSEDNSMSYKFEFNNQHTNN